MTIPSRPKSVRRGHDTSVWPVERTADIPVAAVRPSPFQIRQGHNAEHISALAQSVADIDLSSPILVRPLGDELYELVCGEHRWRAHQALGRETIRATIRQLSDADAAKTLIADNLQHLQINDWEAHLAVNLLLEKEFVASDSDVARLIGRTRTFVTKVKAFNELPDTAKTIVATNPRLFGSNLVADLRSRGLCKTHPELVTQAFNLVVTGALTQSGVISWLSNKIQPRDHKAIKDTTKVINNRRVRVTVYPDTIRIHCPGMDPAAVETALQELLGRIL